jgi:phosphatidylglycerophosphatase A
MGGTAWVAAGAIAITIIGIPIATRMEMLLGREDPGPVVIDEVAGYLVTMIGSPPAIFQIVAGFFLFRFFDILKPPPVRNLEKGLAAGSGIMADDLMAGIYALASLKLLEMLLL